MTGGFTRVSGLLPIRVPIVFRDEGDPAPSSALPPAPAGHATLLDGAFANDAAFQSWYGQIATGSAPGGRSSSNGWTAAASCRRGRWGGARPTSLARAEAGIVEDVVCVETMAVSYETFALTQ